jgi:hypothetical protein
MFVGYFSTQFKSPSLSLKRRYRWKFAQVVRTLNDVLNVVRGGGRVRGRENVLGKEHPDTLANKYILASTLHELGRYEEA